MIKFSDHIIRKLARSAYWQILYARAKELDYIRFFDNEKDFTAIQVYFLQLLELYNSLYADIASGEEYMDEKRIKDDILVEAYLVYKHRKRKETRDKLKQETLNKNKSNVTDRVIFRQRQR